MAHGSGAWLSVVPVPPEHGLADQLALCTPIRLMVMH